MKLSRAAFLALCAALPLTLAGCGEQASSDSSAPAASTDANDTQTLTVRLGTLPTEDILPMWAAESEGLFAEHGLECAISTFQSATELIAAVSAGEVDVAMTDPMVSASLYASGTDVRICWIALGADASQGRFGIMTADEDIADLADLAGKEIGVGSNTILEYVMDKLMQRAGVADEDIVKAELQKLPVRYEAMASGQVAAAALPASLLALGEASGYRCVADDTQGDNISQSVIIVRTAFAADDAGRQALDALAATWDDAAERINASPEDYRALLVEKASLADAVAQTYPVSTYPSVQLPEQQAIDDVLAWMQDKGYLSEALAYDAQSGTFTKE